MAIAIGITMAMTMTKSNFKLEKAGETYLFFKRF